MNDLLKIIQRFIAFENDAKKLLASHESSLHRVITIEETYSKLTGLNLKQDDLFRQAIKCVEFQAFRASHVLSWAAMADYLEEWFALDNFETLLQKRPNWAPIQSVEDLQENYPDYQLIEAFRDCGYCRKNMEKALKGLLAKRNECAHPSNYYPDLNTTLGYLSDLLIRLEMIEKKKKSFFGVSP
ncbi:MAG: hypothetical protein ACW99V_00995 [Candidatus Thorarchaeota archaeon]|jgi:hypothetical protein